MPQPMASVRARAGNVAATDTNSFTPTLPASPLAGSLLLAVIAADGTPTVATMSGGWTKVGQVGTDSVLAVYAGIAGTAAALTVGPTNILLTEQWAANTFEVTGWTGTVGDVSLMTAVGTSATADPPRPTPMGGTNNPARYLRIAAATSASGADAAMSGPPGWSSFTVRRSGTTTAAAWVATMEAVSKVDPVDPPSMQLAASARWAAATISVPAGTGRDRGTFQTLLAS